MSKLPKIAKPRPVKWGRPEVIQLESGGWFVSVMPKHRPEWGMCGGPYGPIRMTKAAAIRAWNKQESKR